jgi:hypothetical protein
MIHPSTSKTFFSILANLNASYTQSVSFLGAFFTMIIEHHVSHSIASKKRIVRFLCNERALNLSPRNLFGTVRSIIMVKNAPKNETLWVYLNALTAIMNPIPDQSNKFMNSNGTGI